MCRTSPRSAARSSAMQAAAGDRPGRVARRASCWSPRSTPSGDRATSRICCRRRRGRDASTRCASPTTLLTNRRAYLDPLNFATNFVFFRDAEGLHTRLVTANYWAGYGAADGLPAGCTLFDERRRQASPNGASRWTRARRRDRDRQPRGARRASASPNSPASCSSIVVGAAGHDVVKYALDTYGDSGAEPVLHPRRQRLAGGSTMPGCRRRAPGERVMLWLQNSHPTPIPAGAIGLNLDGRGRRSRGSTATIAPFATLRARRRRAAARTCAGRGRSSCGPASIWCARATRSIARRAPPHRARQCRARRPASPTRRSPSSAKLLGKGYLLPAPVLPRERMAAPSCCRRRWRRSQRELPIAALALRRDGTRGGAPPLRRAAARPHDRRSTLDERSAALPVGLRPCRAGLRFRRRRRGRRLAARAVPLSSTGRAAHAAETSFGAHVFNTVLTYNDEPQSYAGRPPGLSTRLFLRLGDGAARHDLPPDLSGLDAVAAVSSATEIILHDAAGSEIAARAHGDPLLGLAAVALPARLFDAAARARAGRGAYVVIRDTTCRLFGYHGLLGRATAPSASTTCSDSEMTARMTAMPRTQQGPDHRLRPGRLHRRDLCRARQSAAACWSPACSPAGR